jgi:hypothetical protein
MVEPSFSVPAVQLWTVSVDYFATGEGVTKLACIVQAGDADEALSLFQELFSGRFFFCAQAEPGVVRNEVTDILFTPQALELCGQLRDAGKVVLHASLHFNLS